MRVVIIGAGIAGLACADALVDAGHTAALFDKGRRAGGRMSTRDTVMGGLPLQFDHGAQYFTARDPAFVAQVNEWEALGLAARWPAAGADAWVGTPRMRDPVRAMSQRHHVTRDARIDAIEQSGTGWTVSGGTTGAGANYDAAIVAVPAEQAVPLLAPHAPIFAARAAATPSQPCWTAMAAFVSPVPYQPDVIHAAGALGWAARDSAKPRRGGAGIETWVIQAAPDWSHSHLEDAAEDVAQALLAMLAEQIGRVLPEPIYLKSHRWRYARSGGGDGPAALWDATIGLGTCGDRLGGPRVEAAWLSGRRAANLVIHTQSGSPA